MDECLDLTMEFHSLWVASWTLAGEQTAMLRKSMPGAYKALESRTKANFRRDIAVEHVRHKVGVTYSDALGTFTQIINAGKRSAIIRFKELDENLRTYNQPNDRQDRLGTHSLTDVEFEQLREDGLQSSPTVLTCGYRTDIDGETMSQMLLACHWHRSDLWYYDLETQDLAEVRQFPKGIDPPQSRVISTAKKDASAHEGN
jgi:hypothetical protein